MAELPRKKGEQLSPQELEEQERREAALEEARKIALQILTLTRNGLFVSLRFMDVALCQFDYISAEYAELPFKIKTTATTGEHMIYDPRYIIQQYMRDRKALSRDYLHIVLHCVFRHPFVSTKLNMEYWNLACDMAVENTVCELELKQTEVLNADDIRTEIERIRGFVTKMNAENLYRYLLSGQAAARDLERWKKLFKRDEHDIWWEVAWQIEEEKKRRAEEEAGKDEEPDSTEDSGSSQEQQTDNQEDQEQEEESQEDSGTSDEEESGDAEEEGTESGEEDSEEQETASEDDNAENEPEDGQDQPPEDEEPDNKEYDEYEEEYGSSPGGENENGEGSQGDPNSDSYESEEESSGDGSGGGNPGDEPEQTDEEGADRESDTSTEGLSGHDDGHKPDQDKKGESGDLSG